MSNEPNKAPNAPASNLADQANTTANQAKPEAIVTPAPAVAPVETKKS
ncbi:MAG: hypothetical protein JNL81_11230 [Hyphomonadaceae bacterium]|nr:hypothetical protein [Hyphomonadaceae bacterium]